MKEAPVDSKADQVLNNRGDMVRAPKRASVHLNKEGMVVLSFDDGGVKDGFSFMLSKEMCKQVIKGLSKAAFANDNSSNSFN